MIQDRPADQPPVSTQLHVPTPSAVPHNMAKTEKRGSVLGRLVKKFSILKKPSPDSRNVGVSIDDAKSDKVSRRSEATTRQPSSEKPQMDKRRSTDPAPVKRVPPPSVELEPALPRDTNVPKVGENLPDPDRRSSMISLETPFPVSMGRLTVANPDEPSSADNTPSQSTAPLPPEKPEPAPQVPEKPVEEQAKNAPLPIPPVSPEPTPTRIISPVSPSHPSAPYPDQHHTQHDTSDPRARTESTKPAPPREMTSEAPKQVPEHHSSRRRTESSQAPPPPRPSSEKSKTPSISSVVPFPVAEQPRSPALMVPAVSFPSVIEDSPYSASSMIVNPPTPHTAEPRSITPPPVVPKLEKRRSRDPSPNPQVSTVTSRETETYRLVRSPSGNMHPSTEMIVGAGEQWEVVGTTRSTSSKDKSTKSKDRESGSRKEHRRQEKAEEVDQHRVRSQTRHQSVTGPVASASSSSKLPRASSLEVRRRPAIPDSLISQKDESKSSRKRDGDREQRRSEDKEQRRSEDRGQRRSEDREQRRSEDRERRRDDDRERRRDDDRERRRDDDKERRRGEDRERRRDEDKERKQEEERDRRHSQDRHRRSDRKHTENPSSTSLNVNKPQPSPPPPTPGPPAAVQLERRPSASARPMSELPSAADFNAMRAREAWDMERLWKARSLYEAEPTGMVSAPMPVPSAELYVPAKSMAANGIHGSSHTSFMVQTPFQGQTSHQIYHSLPVNPPPIMYPTSLPQTLHHSSSAHSYTNHHPHHSYPHSYSSPEPLMTIPHSNPLPEPPRESSYSPAPLPPQAWARVVTSNAQ